MKPLLCIGEDKDDKLAGKEVEICSNQIRSGLKGIKLSDASNTLIAYEPVWAIGTNGEPASIEYARHMSSVIKKELISLFGEAEGNRIPILYGGSVSKENAVELLRETEFDGLFIGRSAWEAHNFNEIIRDVMSSTEEPRS